MYSYIQTIRTSIYRYILTLPFSFNFIKRLGLLILFLWSLRSKIDQQIRAIHTNITTNTIEGVCITTFTFSIFCLHFSTYQIIVTNISSSKFCNQEMKQHCQDSNQKSRQFQIQNTDCARKLPNTLF